MKRFILFLIGLLIMFSLFVGSTYYYLSPLYTPINNAVAVIHPTKDNRASGIVHFNQHKDGVHITATVAGLTPGIHGFHIHEFGDCSNDDASSAGDHFNPTHTKHGAPNNPHSHRGDLGNIIADKQGNAQYDAVNNYVQLNGPNSIIGRSVIVHEKKDDLHSQPTGDAGARFGCGVIGISKK